MTIDEWVYWLLALVSPTAFAMAFDRLMVFENLNLPIDLWASMGSMPLGGMLIMLAVGNNMGYENAFEVHKAQHAKNAISDTILYGLLAYYLDNVMPTEYGTVRKPWFCLDPAFWCRRR